MQAFPQVKIEVFIPLEFIEKLRDELNGAGAGHIGNYDHCISVTTVRGYWRPLPGAHPYQGKAGEISSGTEAKVEVNCPWEKVPEALKTIRDIHPYEEPLINIIPLVNHLFDIEIESSLK